MDMQLLGPIVKGYIGIFLGHREGSYLLLAHPACNQACHAAVFELYLNIGVVPGLCKDGAPYGVYRDDL